MSVKILSSDVEVRGAYWKDFEYPGIENDEPSLTKQSFKEECDINNIMKKYNATGVITHVNSALPEYGDFTNPIEFQRALNTVIEAEALFAELPAAIRDRFGNDPNALLEFVSKPENRDEAIELGIVRAPEAPAEPMAVRVVKDEGEASGSPSPQPKGP